MKVEYEFSDFAMETDKGASIVRNEYDYLAEVILLQEKLVDAGKSDEDFSVLSQAVEIGGTYVQYQIEKNIPHKIGI